MNIDELTFGQIKQLKGMFSSSEGCSTPSSHPYKIGHNYLIRTVTMIYTGRLVGVYDQELVIEDAAWIAETDRWADTCKDGKLKEVEPYVKGDQVILGRGAILDVCPWHKDLPETQK